MRSNTSPLKQTGFAWKQEGSSISWGAVIAGGASLIGGAIASNGARSAGRAQGRSADAAIDEQRRQYDQTRTDFAPYREGGAQAYNRLLELYGIQPYQAPQQPLSYDAWSRENPAAAPTGNAVDQLRQRLRNGTPAEQRQRDYQNYLTNFNVDQEMAGRTFDQDGNPVSGPKINNGSQPGTPNYGSFFSSPDYQFALDQGRQTVERSAAARGGLNSGNTLRALTDYGQGMASQQYGNYFNRLAGLAGIGQTATNSTANLGANMAGNVGNLMVGQGNARASGIATQANVWGNTLGSLGGLAYDRFNNRPANNMYAHNYGGPTTGALV